MLEASGFVLSILYLLGFVSWGGILSLLEIFATLAVGLILLRAVRSPVKKRQTSSSIMGLEVRSVITP
jgi:hypothetical protein